MIHTYNRQDLRLYNNKSGDSLISVLIMVRGIKFDSISIFIDILFERGDNIK